MARPPGYLPLRDYGVIGDTRSCALVSNRGSIDWLCWPRFDSPSVFAALLDRRRGGRFALGPRSGLRGRPAYEPGTNVLRTVFRSRSGTASVTDFMPVRREGGRLAAPGAVLRRVRGLRGRVPFRLHFEPRLDYARGRTSLSVSGRVAIAAKGPRSIALSSPVELEKRGGAACADFEVRRGDALDFRLHHTPALLRGSPERLHRETVRFWRRWSARCDYSGPYRDAVVRSALALRLLVYEPTGAMVAAPTTSLPEVLGGGRNWDYRYSWVRDSCFSLWAFHGVGHAGETERFCRWLMNGREDGGRDLHVMYSVDGHHRLPERVLGHLEGYRGSRPVRAGNGAWDQTQLDIYGTALDALYFTHRHGAGVSRPLYRTLVRPLAEHICENWTNRDNGIWEVRGGKRHFVYSKMWCEVGLARAARLARETGYGADAARWSAVRKTIGEEILRKGWDPGRKTFVQSYGSRTLDASNLLMPLVKFLPASDPRIVRTVEATRRSLAADGLLMERYTSPDGLDGREGAFLLCSFWLVSCLARMGRRAEAHRLFRRLLGLASPLGLFSEEVDPRTKELLGNYPQAFTHMGLISAAMELDPQSR